MRTKQQEELEHQERTWIYLLHDQAPPTNQRNVTPAVLAARSAGAMGDHTPHMPLLPSMSAASPMMFHGNNTSNANTSNANNNGGSTNGAHQYHSQGPYVSAHNTGYDAYGRPLHSNNSNNNNNRYPTSSPYAYAREFVAKPPTQRALGSVISAHDKWQVPVYQQDQQQQHSAFPPLRSILSKREMMAYPSAVVPGPIVMKSQQQKPSVAAPSQIQVQSPVVASRPKTQKKAASNNAGLLDLLPKKRRHEEIDEVYVAPAFDEEDDDDDENRLSKRNCFPKKCDFPMCKNSSRSRGFCYSHGGGRRCRMDGCNNGAVSRDLCKRHGGGRRCRINGCKSSSESGGLCYSHGGGRRCSLSWCSARAKKGGFCAVHIGNENAEQPSNEELESMAASEIQASSSETKKAAAVVPPNVVETLLSLGQVKSSSSSIRGREALSSFSSSTGSVSPTSPSLPELSTPRYSSIASLLN